HISWLDMLILYTQYTMQFIARAEIKKWPVISLLIKASGAIFINRTNKRDLIHINQFVSQKLSEGAVIGLFPEGKTSCGISVSTFNASLLKAPIIAHSTIIPVVIKYYTTNGSPTTRITYAGNITFWQSLKNSLLLNGIIVKIAILNPVNAANFPTRNQLAVFLHQQISQQFNLM
ncbi:MAG: 1-acyl-sn-glycerol-3-phosphate acyltransferase, partial [Burkholderiales bacterium]|nr:1-acyl-sn-glycerol-3-phosphate acyltransferase [Burkholderiales bacterium]